MFRKKLYKDATKRIRRENDLGESKSQEFQVITSNRSQLDSEPELGALDLDLIDSQLFHFNLPERTQLQESIKVSENHKHCEVGENNKLFGI